MSLLVQNPLPVIRIAVVGDVHDQWDQQDAQALAHLQVDLLLMVGDFGNESIKLVRQIAQLEIPKAVILGNHDAWYSATAWGRKKSPYDPKTENRVQTQLDDLGIAHVGYGRRDFDELGLSVVGSRPFSWGGSQWLNGDFYRDRYGVGSFKESTEKIVAAARQSPFSSLIFIGHSGPYGLGHFPEDPCGKDWHPIGGDHGDPDFAAAIATTKSLGKAVPLVAFGHMHHKLRHTKTVLRKTCVHIGDTVYLNAACVPRIIETETGQYRHFAVVTLTAMTVTDIETVWINAAGETLANKQRWEHCTNRLSG